MSDDDQSRDHGDIDDNGSSTFVICFNLSVVSIKSCVIYLKGMLSVVSFNLTILTAMTMTWPCGPRPYQHSHSQRPLS